MSHIICGCGEFTRVDNPYTGATRARFLADLKHSIVWGQTIAVPRDGTCEQPDCDATTSHLVVRAHELGDWPDAAQFHAAILEDSVHGVPLPPLDRHGDPTYDITVMVNADVTTHPPTARWSVTVPPTTAITQLHTRTVHPDDSDHLVAFLTQHPAALPVLEGILAREHSLTISEGLTAACDALT